MWIAYAVGAAALWGLLYVLDEKVLESLTSVQLFWLCSFAYFIILTTYLFASSGFGFIGLLGQPALAKFAAVTVIVGLAANFFIYKSIELHTASTAALIEITYPLFTILFTWVLFKEIQLGLYGVVGAAMILGGSYMVVKDSLH